MFVEHQYARMVRDHGEGLKGIGNSWQHARMYRECVAPVCRAARLVLALLEATAVANADATLEIWEQKLNQKLFGLQNATLVQGRGAEFTITGKDGNGRHVRVEQQMILNVSGKGKPFNQFPARIYIDGKFTSEAAYKKGVA